MPRIAPIVAAALAFLVTACGTAFDRPRPAAVAHLDIVRKQDYILATKATLKNFRAAARDLRSRERPVSLRELADRFDRYVALQVAPVVGDFEADNNLATRLEVAKLQLLCALTYVELAEPRKARELATEMKRRYGGNASVMEAPLDRGDIGVSSLQAGLQFLEGQSASALPLATAASRSPQRPTDPRKDEPWTRTPSMLSPMRSSER